MAQTVAVLSQKGGTGKTTTVRTLTDVFRRCGLEVLAVLATDPRLAHLHLVPAARGDLLARAGRHDEARRALSEAARLAPTDQEQRALTRRRDELR